MHFLNMRDDETYSGYYQRLVKLILENGRGWKYYEMAIARIRELQPVAIIPSRAATQRNLRKRK